jgi:hypothetical protein
MQHVRTAYLFFILQILINNLLLPQRASLKRASKAADPNFVLYIQFIQFTIYNLFKNRSCSQEAELQRLHFTKERFKLIILSITD